MNHILTYYHTRNLFRKDSFLPFVKKYFKNVEYLGTELDNWSPRIKVSNWDEAKHDLPKYAIPSKVKFDYESKTITMVEVKKDIPTSFGFIMFDRNHWPFKDNNNTGAYLTEVDL